MHVCSYTEDHRLIPVLPDFDKPETELKKMQKYFKKISSENQALLTELYQKSSSFECFKCSRKFVHEAGLFRHWDKHFGELIQLSPPEDPEVTKAVMQCALCDEIFATDSGVIIHLLTHHLEVMVNGLTPGQGSEEKQEKSLEEDMPTAKKQKVDCEDSVSLYEIVNAHFLIFNPSRPPTSRYRKIRTHCLLRHCQFS